MSEPETHVDAATATPIRPFPWYCPNCRQKDVRRVTIPYQTQLDYKGKPVTVTLTELAVPRCGNCGELVFDYEADDQINRAFAVQAQALDNGSRANGAASQAHGKCP